MKTEQDNPLKKWGALVFFTIVLAAVVFNISAVGSVLDKLIGIAFPFIIGCFLALILNIPSRALERRMGRLKMFKNRKGALRLASLLLAIVIIIFFLLMILLLVVPQLVNVVGILVGNIPSYQEDIAKLWISIKPFAEKLNISDPMSWLDLNAIKDDILARLPGLLFSFLGGATSVVTNFVSGFISLVFAVYLITGKENLKVRSRLFIDTFFGKHAPGIKKILRISLNQFQNYIGAQCLEAVIMGALCTTGLLLLQMPYAITVGVLVGVMVLLPIVGAFISLIVGAILIVVVSPVKALIFIIYLLILQQIEGNLIYPRVVGNKIGLPGMWVLVAIMVGGGLWGVAGIFLGVPAGSVIYILISEKMEKKREAQ